MSRDEMPAELISPQGLISFVCQNLISKPESLKISEIPGSEETVIEIRVDSDDVGKIIGKNGSVARSIRTLVSAMGSRSGVNYVVEIVD
ncbi:KH domain-containing protein [Leptonema illini]|uniref:RNA-binding protein KhpA n=1 Tax=Leptonema illini DSM 21528 TaxID=929563 RepID=H2CH13_9LEPT|nr:KH domain-containing protein [Leptonema illini]EHQ05855.1 RNA-binding protein [Leptonema illini DSM 21528]